MVGKVLLIALKFLRQCCKKSYTKLASERCKFCFQEDCDAINCKVRENAEDNGSDPWKSWGISSLCKECDKRKRTESGGNARVV